MHMARRAAAWVAWAAWICNCAAADRVSAAADCSQKRAGFGPLFFLSLLRPQVAIIGLDTVGSRNSTRWLHGGFSAFILGKSCVAGHIACGGHSRLGPVRTPPCDQRPSLA